jgi:RES domain-containing protein
MLLWEIYQARCHPHAPRPASLTCVRTCAPTHTCEPHKNKRAAASNAHRNPPANPMLYLALDVIIVVFDFNAILTQVGFALRNFATNIFYT